MESKLEHTLMHSYKDEMISFMDAHPECFEEAIELALSDKQPYAWRSAWLLWSCVKKDDPRIKKYVQKILVNIKYKKDGHQRELIKILLYMNLNDEQEGFLFDLCVSIWEHIKKKPSVRFTAFRFIIKMAEKHPELLKEMNFLTQEHYMNSLSPGVNKSISRMIAQNIS